jgi:hypothetical protein
MGNEEKLLGHFLLCCTEPILVSKRYYTVWLDINTCRAILF